METRKGAIWIRKSKNNMTFLSLCIDSVNFIAFKNKNKKDDKSPDFFIYESRKDNKEDIPF